MNYFQNLTQGTPVNYAEDPLWRRHRLTPRFMSGMSTFVVEQDGMQEIDVVMFAAHHARFAVTISIPGRNDSPPRIVDGGRFGYNVIARQGDVITVTWMEIGE